MGEREGTAAFKGYFEVGSGERRSCQKTVFKLMQKYLAQHYIQNYCANTFLPLQNFKWFLWNTWHLLHKFKKIKQHFRRKRKTVEFYIKICSMHHIIASKLTSRLLSSSTAIRSRANSFSDWAKTKAKRMTWSTSHFKIRWVHYLDWSSSDRYCSYKVLPRNQ